jgi:G3E family GTPase
MYRTEPLKVHLFFTQQTATDAFDRALSAGTTRELVDFEDLLSSLFSGPPPMGSDILARCGHDADAQRVIAEFLSARGRFDEAPALAAVVTTVDATTLACLLFGGSVDDIPDGVTSAMATASQIEHASTVVLTGWNEMEQSDLFLLVAALGHLNPSATFVLLGPGGSLGTRASCLDIAEASLNRPGWLHVLSGTFTPRLPHPRLNAFRYENCRPFHPGRLAELLSFGLGDELPGRLIRSAGFCQLASRPRTAFLWDQCGTEFGFAAPAIEAYSSEPVAFGQDLAIFGLDLDVAQTVAALDECVLDDTEFLLGPDGWKTLPDPFPR